MYPFEYVEPATVAEAVAILGRGGEEARLLAGGQSLLPMMTARLVSPRVVVSLRAIPELRQVQSDERAGLRIGAMVTQRTIERSPLIRQHCPVLADAAARIATIPVRNLGTLGGNLCHNLIGADPPPVLMALDASATIVGPRGQRAMLVDQLFTGLMETALAPDEILTEVQIPPLAPCSVAVYTKHCLRAVDPALVGVALAATSASDGDGWSDVRVVVGGVGEIPSRLRAAEAQLRGRTLDRQRIQEAAALAMDAVDPIADAHGSANYRRRMVGVILERTIEAALAQRAS